MGNRAYINGNEGGQILLSKGADRAFNVLFTDKDGAALDITGASFSLEVYADAARSAAAVKSHAGVLGGTLTDGRGTITISAANASYGPGTYYGHMKYTSAAGKIEFMDAIYAIVVD